MLSRAQLEDLAKSCENLAAGAIDEVTRWKLESLAADYRRRAKWAPEQSGVPKGPMGTVFDQELAEQVTPVIRSSRS